MKIQRLLKNQHMYQESNAILRWYYALFLLLWIIFSSTPQAHAIPQSNPQILGTPFAGKGAYARNIWDMQLFSGKIYLGHGNRSNLLPSPNSGPCAVVSYDPLTGQFQQSFTVDEEQIEHFLITNESLVIPGHDARETGTLGNYYVLEAQGWKKYRNIPEGTHVFDLARFQEKWFAALGTFSSVLIKSSNGVNWTSALPPPLSSTSGIGATGGRALSIFEFNNNLYGITLVRQPSQNFAPIVLLYDTVTEIFKIAPVNWSINQQGVVQNALFPGLSLQPGRDYSIARSQQFQEKLIYLGARTENDMQWEPFGLFVTQDLTTSQQITLGANIIPRDILIRNNTVYVLGTEAISPGLYRSHVYSSSNLSDWTEALFFDNHSFARSFEEYSGYFYFGMGTSTAEQSALSGSILRVARESISTPKAPSQLEVSMASSPKDETFVAGTSTEY